MKRENSVSEDLLKRIEAQELTAREFGFYWKHLDQLVEQVNGECAEIQEAFQKDDPAHLQEEVGDLLHAAFSLCVFLDLDPHATLSQALDKFQRRYDHLLALVKEDGRDHLLDESMDLLWSYWRRAKERAVQEKTAPSSSFIS